MNMADVLNKLMAERTVNGKALNNSSLGELAGIPPPTIQRIRKGVHKNANPETVLKLANFFGITPAQMRGEEPIEGGGQDMKVEGGRRDAPLEKGVREVPPEFLEAIRSFDADEMVSLMAFAMKILSSRKTS